MHIDKQLERSVRLLLSATRGPGWRKRMDVLRDDPSPEICIEILEDLTVWFYQIADSESLQRVEGILLGYKAGKIPNKYL